MKITINEDQGYFTFQNGDQEYQYTFQEILESKEWKESKTIKLIHKSLNEYGYETSDTLTREIILENLKSGDENYHQQRGFWDLNTTIHKLYALLDGKSSIEAEEEIKNLSKQHDNLRQKWLQENNENVEKVFALEKEMKLNKYDFSKTKAERDMVVAKIEKKLKKQREFVPTTNIPKELKKMYFAARDQSKPEITLANVTPEAVKEAYGDSLIIQ